MDSINNFLYCFILANNFIFKDGQKATFVAGRFVTDNKDHAAQLQAEIDSGNYIFSLGTADDKVIAEAGGDPLAALREKFFKEFQERQAQVLDDQTKGKVLGSSVTGTLNVASTKAIEAVTANQGKK